MGLGSNRSGRVDNSVARPASHSIAPLQFLRLGTRLRKVRSRSRLGRFQTGSGSASCGSRYRCLEIARATRGRSRGLVAGVLSATTRGIEIDSVEVFKPTVVLSPVCAILITVFAADVDGAGSRTGRRIYNGLGTCDSRHVAPCEIASVGFCHVAGILPLLLVPSRIETAERVRHLPRAVLCWSGCGRWQC